MCAEEARQEAANNRVKRRISLRERKEMARVDLPTTPHLPATRAPRSFRFFARPPSQRYTEPSPTGSAYLTADTSDTRLGCDTWRVQHVVPPAHTADPHPGTQLPVRAFSQRLTLHLSQTSAKPFVYLWYKDIMKRRTKMHFYTLIPSACSHQPNSKIFYKKVVVWKRLSHPNVVSLLSITTAPLQFISDWMNGGTLLECIQPWCRQASTRRVSMPLRTSYTYPNHQLFNIVNCLNYLHSCDVVHGNLKGVRG